MACTQRIVQLHYVYTLTHAYTHLHTHVHAMGNCQLTCVAKWQAQHIRIRSRIRIGTSFQQVVALSPLSDIVPYNLSYVDRPTVRPLALVSMLSYDMCSSIRYFACVAVSAAHTEDYVAGFSSFRFFSACFTSFASLATCRLSRCVASSAASCCQFREYPLAFATFVIDCVE